jgi:uroporphyrinogen decarboxylase
MNKRERVLAAIAHREGDRVPKGEVAIEHEFAQAMVEAYPELAAQHQPPPCPSPALALEAQVRAMLHMDLWIVGDWPRPQIGSTPEGYALRRDVWGRVIVDSGASTETLAYPIADIEQAGDYRFPSVEAIPGDDLRWVVEHTDYLPGGIINSVFEDVYNLVGFEQYMMVLASEPEKLRPLAQQCAAFEVAKACRFLDLGAEMILIVEDIAHNTGTFVSPRALRSEIFPTMRWQVAEIKRYRQAPVLFHSDGDLNTVLDDIVACGYDGLHSLQPSANMDIARIKARYGQRLCLMGNIDINYVLPFGSPEEVEKAVRETMRVAAPGGGYILSTCNTLIRAIPPRNALAMYRAGERPFHSERISHASDRGQTGDLLDRCQ